MLKYNKEKIGSLISQIHTALDRLHTLKNSISQMHEKGYYINTKGCKVKLLKSGGKNEVDNKNFNCSNSDIEFMRG